MDEGRRIWFCSGWEEPEAGQDGQSAHSALTDFSTRACFQNLIMEENGSFQVRAEGSTRGRVELRPRAGAVPKPFENTL